MPDPKPALRIKPIVPLATVGVVGLVFLYIYNPQDISFFPKCPFYALTGYKCPGCGTSRAIHAILHFRFADAFRLNPSLIVAIPVLLGLLLSRKLAFNVTFGKWILAITVGYWILRNVLGF